MTDGAAGLRTVADYQFGAGAGLALFPEGEDRTVTRTSSGRPRQVSVSGARLVTYGTDGRFRLGIAGGHRLHGTVEGYRVGVGEESVPHVTDGRNAFAKFVTAVDEQIRPGDEVLVVRGERLVAVGRAELAGRTMREFDTGVAVTVRDEIET